MERGTQGIDYESPTVRPRVRRVALKNMMVWSVVRKKR